jgi:hypothetical protein
VPLSKARNFHAGVRAATALAMSCTKERLEVGSYRRRLDLASEGEIPQQRAARESDGDEEQSSVRCYAKTSAA